MIFSLGNYTYVVETIIDRTFQVINDDMIIADKDITSISFNNSGTDDVIINEVLTVKAGDPILDFASDLPSRDRTKFMIRFKTKNAPRLEVIITKVIGYSRKRIHSDAIMVPTIKK